MSIQTFKMNVTAAAGWVAARTATLMQHPYEPVFLEPGSAAAAIDLAESYSRAVAVGTLNAEKLQQVRTGGHAAWLDSSAVTKNLKEVGDGFAKAAAEMDPDGLAAELVRLFCIGVPHMDNMDNRRRVVMVWSSILAPSVVMRQFAGKPITLDRLSGIAQQWVSRGFTEDARIAHASSKTRFISRHPKRIYQLLADTAIAHKLDHGQLVRSVIEPVLLSVGQYVGASAFEFPEESPETPA